jgi:hypothetical protein
MSSFLHAFGRSADVVAPAKSSRGLAVYGVARVRTARRRASRRQGSINRAGARTALPSRGRNRFSPRRRPCEEFAGASASDGSRIFRDLRRRRGKGLRSRFFGMTALRRPAFGGGRAARPKIGTGTDDRGRRRQLATIGRPGPTRAGPGPPQALERVAAKVDPGFASEPAQGKESEPANRFIRFATGSRRQRRPSTERRASPTSPKKRRGASIFDRRARPT